jgi:hypothetical protein
VNESCATSVTPSAVFELLTAIVTSATGWLVSATLNVALPPALARDEACGRRHMDTGDIVVGARDEHVRRILTGVVRIAAHRLRRARWSTRCRRPTTASSAPVTVTVCGTFQSAAAVNVSADTLHRALVGIGGAHRDRHVRGGLAAQDDRERGLVPRLARRQAGGPRRGDAGDIVIGIRHGGRGSTSAA